MLQAGGDDAIGEDDGATEAVNGATDAGNGTVGPARVSVCVFSVFIFVAFTGWMIY
jgi:hypothetical protein